MKTVRDLKEYLQNVMDNLEDNYQEDEELNFHCNTYGIGDFFLSYGSMGYLVLENPVREDEEE